MACGGSRIASGAPYARRWWVDRSTGQPQASAPGTTTEAPLPARSIAGRSGKRVSEEVPPGTQPSLGANPWFRPHFRIIAWTELRQRRIGTGFPKGEAQELGMTR